MTHATLRQGRAGETTAADFLLSQGWRILARNFRCRAAELDLIALDGQTLVFVEVKQRNTRAMGLPEEAITSAKIHKMRQAAEYFLKTRPAHASRECRFDAIALEGKELRHHRDIA